VLYKYERNTMMSINWLHVCFCDQCNMWCILYQKNLEQTNNCFSKREYFQPSQIADFCLTQGYVQVKKESFLDWWCSFLFLFQNRQRLHSILIQLKKGTHVKTKYMLSLCRSTAPHHVSCQERRKKTVHGGLHGSQRMYSHTLNRRLLSWGNKNALCIHKCNPSNRPTDHATDHTLKSSLLLAFISYKIHM
jgi:hypothetical protein